MLTFGRNLINDFKVLRVPRNGIAGFKGLSEGVFSLSLECQF